MTEHRSSKRRPAARSESSGLMQKPWAAKPQQESGNKKPVSAKVLKQNRSEEAKIYGENACRVAFEQRPDALVRLYLNEQLAPKFADLMKFLAKSKKAYHIVTDDELEKISGSQHHGGVVLLLKRKPVRSIATYLQQPKKRDCLLALDGVGNPHNLGAIARTCAHFGISGILMKEAELLANGAAARTAEGGVEFVEGLHCDSLPLALKLCKDAGYTLVTTSSHGGESLYKTKLPAKVVVVFGEEMFGVSQSVAKAADIALQIPGTGHVESLNVSVAASLILGEWYRQQG